MTIPRIAQTPRADHTIARLGVATSMVTVGFTIRAIFNGLLGGTRSERCVAFNDIERKRIEHDLATFMAPPPHIRPELDFGYRISGHSVEIFEIRPQWEKMEHAVAKATFVRTRNIWRVFWMRSDLKWYGYEPVPRSAAWRHFSLSSVAMNTAASLGNHRVRRLTLRSTGPAGTSFDLRSASRRLPSTLGH